MQSALMHHSHSSPLTELSPARLQGWVDLDKSYDDQIATVIQTEGSNVEVRGNGLSAIFDPKIADWHASNGKVVLLVGHPTVQGHRARASDLAAAAENSAIGGRFALVVIDQSARSIQLQTDRFGVWPLCWALEGNRVAFSDRADCVPALGRPTLDPQALFDYAYFHMIPAPRTVFRGVFRVEPASRLRIFAGGVSTLASWQPSFSDRRQGSEQELARRFLNAIRDAVSFEAEGGMVGCFLSGGTDSSTVAGMLKETSGAAPSFSIGFDEQGYDEMEYARIAARHFGTQHHEHYVTSGELISAIPAVGAHYDQPFGNSSAVPAFICARLARENGVEKLLAGDGGDELFGGNSRYARQKLFEAWWYLPQALRRPAAALFGSALTREAPILRKAASYIEQARVPMPARLETYNLLKRFGHANIFRPEFLQLVDATAPERLQAQVYARHATAPFVDRMMAYDWRFTLADNDLPKVCGTTRLAGIDVGFPLLADEIVDLSTELGPSDKVRGLRLRHFFKQSLVGFLPPQILVKKKHGFGLPVGRWLAKDPAFRSLARSSVAELETRGLVLPALVDDLFSRHLEAHPGYYGEMVWVLMMLEQWLAARHPQWRVA